MVNWIYPAELQLNKANSSDTEAPISDFNISISNGKFPLKFIYLFYFISCDIIYILFTNLQSIMNKNETMCVCMYVCTYPDTPTHIHKLDGRLRLYRALIHAWALIYTYKTLRQDYIEHWFIHTHMQVNWDYIVYDIYIHDGRLRLYRALIHTYMMVNWDYIDTCNTVN